MASPPTFPPSSTIPPETNFASSANEEPVVQDEIALNEKHNLAVLVLNQIVFRIGWMFKTETVIMPAFLDAISGAGWIRGFLPVLSRLGQGIPQFFWASKLQDIQRKKWAFAWVVIGMSLTFGVLAIVNYVVAGNYPSWLAWLYLGLYFTFFVLGGLNNLSFGTLQGKLIRPTRRGALLWISSFFGTIPAIAITLWLMPGWLKSDPPSFDRIFAVVAVCLFISALIVLFVKEPADKTPSKRPKTDGTIREVIKVLRADANLRRLVMVVMLANSNMILFPHYQALAREVLGLGGGPILRFGLWYKVPASGV